MHRQYGSNLRIKVLTGHVRSAFTLIGLLLISGVARERAVGQTIYQTGFEAQAFTAGSSVDGQGGFAVTTGAPSAITISITQPRTGAQDLLFTGSALSDTPPPIGPGYFVGTASVTTNVDAGPHGVFILSAALELNGPNTADPGGGTAGDLVSINLEANLSDGSYFSTYLSSDGMAYGFSQGATFYHYDAATPVTMGAYHDAEIIIDLANRTTDYLIDGQMFGSVVFDPSVASTVLANASLSMYAIDPPADHTQYSARVDDLLVRAVPEPSAFLSCLIGTVVVATLRLRRRFPR